MSKFFFPKQSPLWFLQNRRTFLYFLRELTGVVIAAYCVYFAFAWSGDEAMKFVRTSLFGWISMITFAASILHTITWLWVTTQVTPMPIPKTAQYIMFFVLIGVALGMTFGLYYLFYS